MTRAQPDSLAATLSMAATAPPSRLRSFRVAFYSHDTYGLGHLRRSQFLIRCLQHLPGRCEILLITGSPRARFYELPPGVELATLPPVTKNAAGEYVSRHSETPLRHTLRLRKRIIRESIVGFRPDVFVVDHCPTGLKGELLPLLGDLRHRTNTQLVLGLRDILDDPEVVKRDWRRHGVYRLLESIYHQIWVYGSREVFPLEQCYDLPHRVAARMFYLGYLGRTGEARAGSVPSLSCGFRHAYRSHLLCLLGGGGDGFPLARCFVDALAAESSGSDDGWNGTLVTGPFLSRSKRQRIAQLAESLPHLQVLRFTTDIEHWIQASDAVVTMGGYNALMESISLEKRTIVVPRVFPRREQWLRAQAFARLGLVHAVEPEELTAQTLRTVIRRALRAPRPQFPPEVNVRFDGGESFARRMEALWRRSEDLDKNTRSEETGHGVGQLLRA